MDVAAARPGWWIPGAHLQTLWARLARSRRLIGFEREVLETPDGDELVLDHVLGPPDAPRVLLLHGTEGSAYSLMTPPLRSRDVLVVTCRQFGGGSARIRWRERYGTATSSRLLSGAQ